MGKVHRLTWSGIYGLDILEKLSQYREDFEAPEPKK